MDTNEKTYAVLTWKLANRLNALGFKPIGKRLDFKDPTHEVILFKDTPELHEAIQKLTAKKG